MLKQRTIENNRGITLVALIVTIIILIILAAVTIMTIYDSNFIGMAMNGTENYAKEQYREMEMINSLNSKLNDAVDKISQAGENNDNNSHESDLGVKHVSNNEWIADVPADNWFAKQEYYDTEWEGSGTSESPYLITSEKELAGLSYKVSNGELYNEPSYFKLTKNLSMGKHIWVPIGDPTNAFGGVFDGDGHTISGIYYNDDKSNHIGLFGYVQGKNATQESIVNVGIKDSYIKGDYTIGGICGNLKATIKNCYNESIIMGQSDVGGLVGTGQGNVKYSYNKGNVIIVNDRLNTGCVIGGLVGKGKVNAFSYYNCGNVNVENIESVSVIVGGIVGAPTNNTGIYNSYNSGDIEVKSAKGNTYVGGICGTLSNTFIYNACNFGSISSDIGNIGGIIGNYSNANNSTNKMNYCYFERNVNKNSSLDAIGYTNTSDMQLNCIGYFDSILGTSFIYTNGTSEPSGYEGNLIDKLNKWVDDNPYSVTTSNINLRWKIDSNTGYPTFM